MLEKVKKHFQDQAQELGVDNMFALAAARSFIKTSKEYSGSTIVTCVDEKSGKTASNEGTRIQIVQPDRPFLVNSVQNYLVHSGLTIKSLLHPVIPDLKLARFQGSLSSINIELERNLNPEEAKAAIRGLKGIMRDVEVVTSDFQQIRNKVLSLTQHLSIPDASSSKDDEAANADARATLHWVLDDNFIFLGMGDVTLGDKSAKGVKFGGRLGLFKSNFNDYKDELDSIVDACNKNPSLLPRPLVIEKSGYASTVHRDTWMDIIMVSSRSKKGEKPKLYFIYGLWTAAAVRQEVNTLPFFAEKVQRLRKSLGIKSDAREHFFRHNLSMYPWEGLERLSDAQLSASFKRLLRLRAFPRPCVVRHRHRFLEREQIFFVIPRERYSANVRRRIFDEFEKNYSSKLLSWRINLGEDSFARLVGEFSYPRGLSSVVPNPERDEQVVQKLVRSWDDDLSRLLSSSSQIQFDFPESYKLVHSPSDAVRDLDLVRDAHKRGFAFGIDFSGPDGNTKLTLARRYRQVALTRVLPVFERCAVLIDTEDSYLLRLRENQEQHPDMAKASAAQRIEKGPLEGINTDPDAEDIIALQRFGLDMSAFTASQLESLKRNADLLLETLALVFNGDTDDDFFNALSWTVGLTPLHIEFLRAIVAWSRQAGMPFEQASAAQFLSRVPHITRNLIDFFVAMHKSQVKSNSALREWHMVVLENELTKVQSQSEDKLARFLFGAIEAIMRTNFFSRKRGEALVMKFASKQIDGLVLPRPLREIYVYHTDFEGVHLRFGMIARGGIRWSDRLDDYRTEVLGLAKAQQVKNAAIVPVGAKGGFVLKRLPAKVSPAERTKIAVSCYKHFIGAMLSISDDNVDGRVKRPSNIICYDDPDPYLVVAADKGTAAFSDYANEVSQDAGFWLDDAFASGGKNGYDHKKMGITAKGGWESVKRHFYEIGINPERDPITVVGVGDMSGDVFGNGMLLSKSMKLVAAFSHRHIFIDPDPDPEKSFREREKLFNTPGSSWADYPASSLSEGGIIIDRAEKTVTLNATQRAFLGLQSTTVEPDLVIRNILLREVDLMWFGGIGTYVKAHQESDADTNDIANNYVRVDARDLRVKVIGEGANLAMTQLARVEFEQNGGAINADLIDNAGGVSCSDLEVNIKILLGATEKRNKLSRTKRNALLERNTEKVSELVLDGSYERALALSHWRSAADLDLGHHRRLLRLLEREAELDRRLEYLPEASELERRSRQGVGLTRPELSVLQAYAKNHAITKVLEEKWDVPLGLLKEYFPQEIVEVGKGELANHPLAREIVVTQLVNDCLHRTNIDFIHVMVKSRGFSYSTALFSYVVAREVLGLRDLWLDWKNKENDWEIGAHLSLTEASARIIEETAHFFAPILNDMPMGEVIESYLIETRKMIPLIKKANAPIMRKGVGDMIESLSGRGVDQAAISGIVDSLYARRVCSVLRAARRGGIESSGSLLEKHLMIGEQYGMATLTQRLLSSPRPSTNAEQANDIMLDSIFRFHDDLAILLVKSGMSDLPDSDARDDYLLRIAEFSSQAELGTDVLLLWNASLEVMSRVSHSMAKVSARKAKRK